MPILDGIEATRLIKADEATRLARVIAYTADSSSSARYRTALFADVLQKPADAALVLATVQRVARMFAFEAWMPSTAARPIETATEMVSAKHTTIVVIMRALLGGRKPGRTICPSDVARIVGGPKWRTLLALVREQAVMMMTRGDLEILRRGHVVQDEPTQGVLRYRLPAALMLR